MKIFTHVKGVKEILAHYGDLLLRKVDNNDPDCRVEINDAARIIEQRLNDLSDTVNELQMQVEILNKQHAQDATDWNDDGLQEAFDNNRNYSEARKQYPEYFHGFSYRQCPDCLTQNDQVALLSREDPNEQPTSSSVWWCPCGCVYIIDDHHPTVPHKAIKVYSFYDHVAGSHSTMLSHDPNYIMPKRE